VSIDGKTRVDDDVWHHVAYVFVMEPIVTSIFDYSWLVSSFWRFEVKHGVALKRRAQ